MIFLLIYLSYGGMFLPPNCMSILFTSSNLNDDLPEEKVSVSCNVYANAVDL